LKTAKEIWNALQTAYQNEKQGTNKFLALQQFEFKMVDTKPIIDQIYELQVLVSKLRDLEVVIPDALQIGAILAKLPASWNNYRKKILHSSDKLTLEQFRTHLQIETETRAREAFLNSSNSTVNFISQKNHNGNNKNLNVSKKPFKKRTNLICFHCGKQGHVIRECRFKKAGKNFNSANSGNTEKVNLVESFVQEMVAMITEINMASPTIKNHDWFLDSGATVHICNNKSLFKTYSEEPDTILWETM